MNINKQILISDIQNNLRQIRNILKLTSIEFAEYLGVTRQTVNNMEIKKSAVSPAQAIAILAMTDHKLKRNSTEYRQIQKILRADFGNFHVSSFVEYWFAFAEAGTDEQNMEIHLNYLYSTLTDEKIKKISLNDFISESDKIYVFYDFMLKKEIFGFFDILTKSISLRKKILPIVILKTHLNYLLAEKTPETERHIIKLYEKFSSMKEKGFLIIENSEFEEADIAAEYNSIKTKAAASNLFVSILSENREINMISRKPCSVYGYESFTGI